MELVKEIAFDWALDISAGGVRASKRTAPELKLPLWIDAEAVARLLDIFGALLLRWASVLDMPLRTEVRPTATKIFRDNDFRRAKINQWSWFFDTGNGPFQGSEIAGNEHIKLPCFGQPVFSLVLERVRAINSSFWALACDSSQQGAIWFDSELDVAWKVAFHK